MVRSNAAAEPALNATPLIDVLLVLLVMLIFTIPVATHNVAINLPRPTPQTDQPRPEIVALDVDFDGTMFWDGEAVDSIPSLERRLKALMARDPRARVDVRPDRRSAYGPTAQLLAATQRAHVKNLVIAQVPDR